MFIKKRSADQGFLNDYGDNPREIDAQAQHFLDQMTLKEKIRQMSGDLHLVPDGIPMLWAYNRTPMPAGENRRLGIPGIRFTDGPRGVVMHHATCFPVSMARAATWDTDLEERIGDAIGVEARSLGANFFGGVCINLLRHPAWGRAQETYGEDSYLLGEMGAALTRGVQRHVMACAKHYALNSMENARFKVDVRVDERTLREVYLPHFKRCVDEGVASVMSAYNRVNGEWCSHHHTLLRKILKQEWGFEGFVLSDFVYAVHDAREAVLGGLDVEMPFVSHYRRNLGKLVRRGEVPKEVIDESVLRILHQKIRFSQIGEPERYGPGSVLCAEHIHLAREAAQKSIVLLKNDPPVTNEAPLLPFDRGTIRRLAVIGRLAALPNTGDRGSSRVHPPYVVTPLQGIQSSAGDIQVTYADGSDLGKTVQAARLADAVVMVVGYTYQDEGEYFKKPFQPVHGGDRIRLSLSLAEERLILAIARANPKVVVCAIAGSAVLMETWRHEVPTILISWYGGMEGGHALADVLFGRVNPSGKLPCTFPRSADQLPFFDRDADCIDYHYYHGYRLFDKEGLEAAFPFGYGLSYTQYKYSNLTVTPEDIHVGGSVQVTVDITNTGTHPGTEIVQMYAGYRDSDSGVDHPVKSLKGFQKVTLPPGETKTASFHLRMSDLAYYDIAKNCWQVEPGSYAVYAGASSLERDLLCQTFQVDR